MIKSFVILVCVVLSFFQLNSQYTKVLNTDYYELFDNITGKENTVLYNGILFFDEFKVINDKHRYWNSQEYIIGTIEYDSQVFYNQKIKYNLFTDEILINPIGTSSALILQLRKSKVKKITLEGHEFFNIGKVDFDEESKDLGFCEILEKNGSYLLLKKSKKIKIEKRNTEFKYYEFSESIDYYLKKGKIFHLINSKGNLISLFPNSKKQINAFFKKYKKLRKSDEDSFISLIFNDLVTAPIIK